MDSIRSFNNTQSGQTTVHRFSQWILSTKTPIQFHGCVSGICGEQNGGSEEVFLWALRFFLSSHHPTNAPYSSLHEGLPRLQHKGALGLTWLLQLQNQGWHLTKFQLHPNKITNENAGLKYWKIQSINGEGAYLKKDKVSWTLDQKFRLIR